MEPDSAEPCLQVSEREVVNPFHTLTLHYSYFQFTLTVTGTSKSMA